MPLNLYAALRYQAIHQRLKQPDLPSQWKDLAEVCADLIASRLGERRLPAKRTIHQDIHRMRNGHLGYEAPIDYSKERGYYYTNPDFVRHDLQISKKDLANLREALAILRSVTQEIGAIDIDMSLITIQDKLGLPQPDSEQKVIYLERSHNVDGMRWIDDIYHAIRKQQTIRLHYVPFDEEACYYVLSPYYIKEYNNRWYVIGHEHQHDKIFNIALDRVQDIKPSLLPFLASAISLDDHYQHVYGVTRHKDAMVENIVLDVDADLRPYILTKPILPSQQVDPPRADGSGIIRLKAVINYELTSLLMGWGPALEVVHPPVLRQIMKDKIAAMAQRYHSVEK